MAKRFSSPEYFKRGELWKWDVSPVLLAVATLQTMLKRSVVAGTQVYHHAIQLLKYIHYETPPLGNAKRYVDLLLELKTRVSSRHTLALAGYYCAFLNSRSRKVA